MTAESLARARLEMIARKVIDTGKDTLTSRELGNIISDYAGFSHTTLTAYRNMLIKEKIIFQKKKGGEYYILIKKKRGL